MYYSFLGGFGEGGYVTIAMLVSSSAIPHCLPSLLGSDISALLKAQSHDFTVNSGNQILMDSFLSLNSPKSSVFPIIITLSSICQCLIVPLLKSFQVIFLINCKGVVESFGV